MNQNMVQGSWNEIKGKIRTKFAKFTDDDLESFKGHLDQIAGKLQKVYGYAQERAEKEYNELKASFNEVKKDAQAPSEPVPSKETTPSSPTN